MSQTPQKFLRNILRRSRNSRPNTVATDGPSISFPNNFKVLEVAKEDIQHDCCIEDCPFDVSGFGKLLLKDEFKVKGKKVLVYLFEEIIIFTKKDKTNDASYYFASVKINHIIVEPSSEANKLILRDFYKSRMSKSTIEYKLEGTSKDVIAAWRDNIQKCLWKELLRLKSESRNVDSSKE